MWQNWLAYQRNYKEIMNIFLIFFQLGQYCWYISNKIHWPLSMMCEKSLNFVNLYFCSNVWYIKKRSIHSYSLSATQIEFIELKRESLFRPIVICLSYMVIRKLFKLKCYSFFFLNRHFFWNFSIPTQYFSTGKWFVYINRFV